MMLLVVILLFHILGVQCQTFTNPIRSQSSDPHIVTYKGIYYLTHTEGSLISVTKSNTIAKLQQSEGTSRTVWTDTNTSRNKNIWAPEMHLINGIWHIFYTAGNGDIGTGQRSFVIRGCDLNPYDCSFTFLAELTPAAGNQGGADGNNPWSIDGTWLNFAFSGGVGSYHVNSALNAAGIQSITIATLDTDTFTVGPWHVISSPEQPWEMADPVAGEPAAVNEGPNALYYDNKTWLSFSASWCGTPTYALGLLAYDGVGDPLNATSWTKKGPVFSSTMGDFVGTGHNVFFSSPDGKEVWNGYHATSNSAGSCGPDRYTNAQLVTFDADGNPDLGTPQKNGTYNLPSGDGQLVQRLLVS